MMRARQFFPRHHLRCAHKQAGYILPLLLVSLLALSLGVATVVREFDKSSDFLEDHALDLDSMAGMLTFEADVAYYALIGVPDAKAIAVGENPVIAGTRRRVTTQPLDAVSDYQVDTQPVYQFLVDGSGYEYIPEHSNQQMNFAVQDVNGLWNFNRATKEVARRFLVFGGFEDRAARVLAAQWVDYVDTDSSPDIDGAEETLYRARSRPEPPNRAVTYFSGITAVIDWELYGDWNKLAKIMPLTRLGADTTRFNPNTAPPHLVRLIFNLDSDTVESSRNSEREDQNYYSEAVFLEDMGVDRGDNIFTGVFQVGRRLIISYRSTENSPVHRMLYQRLGDNYPRPFILQPVTGFYGEKSQGTPGSFSGGGGNFRPPSRLPVDEEEATSPLR